MRILFSMILLILVLTTGCTSFLATPATPVLAPATFTATEPVLTSTSIVTVTSRPTSTPTRFAPTEPIIKNTPTITSTPILAQEVISPQLKTICPEQQVVPFEALELHPDSRLLLLSGTVDAYPRVPAKPLILSPGNSTPQTIFEDALLSYRVSPDHQWISFYRPGDDEKHVTLWISSLDGQEQWPVMQISNNNYAVWVSEQEIFIVGSPNAEEYEKLDIWDIFPFMSVNPFTMEQRPLTYLAGDRTQGRYYYGAMSSEGHLYTMYGRINMVDYLYDYDQEKALPVFQWLNEVDIIKMIATVMAPIWVYDGGNFAVTVARSDGIDLAFGLDIQLAGKDRRYNEMMKRVLLPERMLPFTVLGVIPGQNQIALQRFDYSSLTGPNWFYVLDYSHATIKDYCLDLNNLAGPTKFSPDGRFAAFSLEDDMASAEKDRYYVGILNLESGQIAYLPGYMLVGWGMVGEVR